MRRVVVTGMGIVSSIGNDLEEVSASLREAGASPEEITEVLDAMTPPPPDDEEIVLDQDLREKALAMLASGEPFDGLDFSLANLADLDFSGRSLQGTLLIAILAADVMVRYRIRRVEGAAHA